MYFDIMKLNGTALGVMNGVLNGHHAEKLNMAFYETSAKDKTMVDDAFFALTRDIKKRLGESSGGPSTTRTTGPITVPFADSMQCNAPLLNLPFRLKSRLSMCCCLNVMDLPDRCQTEIQRRAMVDANAETLSRPW